MLRFLLISLLFFAQPVLGQPLPDYTSITVNDFADLLDDDAEAEISAQLDTLRKTTGIEMTVLTLESQRPYWKDMQLEPFATALFNHWGIGDARRNDGILVMILSKDQTMRIELGSGYGQKYNQTAVDVIERSFLPGFRRGDLQGGILKGVPDTIDSIALPHSRGRVMKTTYISATPMVPIALMNAMHLSIAILLPLILF